MKLSILICTTHNRHGFLNKLFIELEKQLPQKDIKQSFISGRVNNTHLSVITYGDIEVLVCDDNGYYSIGSKRNTLLEWAKGDYLCFFDDDDLPGETYIEEMMNAINGGYDCCELIGEITIDGEHPKLFKHFLGCEKYDEIDGVYVRYPNHLNCIKSDIAKQFKFPDFSHGEDTDWATQIHKSGLLKTMYPVNKIIYHYKYRSIKNA